MRSLVLALYLGSTASIALAAQPAAVAETQSVSPQALVDSLLAADREFSTASAQTDSVSGLSAMLDDDAVLFVIPIPGLAHSKDKATEILRKGFGSPGSKTEWQPIRGGVSADGQQGFTYGYSTTKAEGQPDKLGKYVSYWIKRPLGWRVAAYKWIPRAPGNPSLALREASLPARIVPVSNDDAAIAGYKKSLDQAERNFSADSQATGLGTAFRKYGKEESMNFAGETEFTFGNEAIAIAQGGDAPGSPFSWAPDGVLVASSGDLGLTWGMLTRTGPVPPGRLAQIPFFTAWKRNSPTEPWYYVAE